MSKLKINAKNSLGCNDAILKAMSKRRRLAFSAIANLCETQQKIRVVK